MELKQDICPHCGSIHATVGRQLAARGVGGVVPEHALTSIFSTVIYHVICFECGTVIRSYVENPKVLDKPDTF